MRWWSALVIGGALAAVVPSAEPVAEPTDTELALSLLERIATMTEDHLADLAIARVLASEPTVERIDPRPQAADRPRRRVRAPAVAHSPPGIPAPPFLMLFGL